MNEYQKDVLQKAVRQLRQMLYTGGVNVGFKFIKFNDAQIKELEEKIDKLNEGL